MASGFDLVTGGNGFIGSHLVGALVHAGRDVVVLCSPQGRLDNLRQVETDIRVVRGDVRQPGWREELGRVEIERIFHLAANASVPRSAREPIYNLTTNIQGTVNVLQLAQERGARFIFGSSAGVYGRPHYTPMDENHPTQPISHFGVSKLAAEQYVDFYRRELALDTRIVRYFNVYGPRQPRYIVFDYLTKAFQPGDVFEVLGTGEQVRTQLIARDAVTATLLVAEQGDHRPYNIGSEEAYSVLELASLVLDVTGQGQKSVRTTGESWPGDIQVMVPDITRLKGLGFTQKTSLRDGLAEVLQWWKQPTESVS